MAESLLRERRHAALWGQHCWSVSKQGTKHACARTPRAHVRACAECLAAAWRTSPAGVRVSAPPRLASLASERGCLVGMSVVAGGRTVGLPMLTARSHPRTHYWRPLRWLTWSMLFPGVAGSSAAIVGVGLSPIGVASGYYRLGVPSFNFGVRGYVLCID
eukprot:1536199-Amphidinium_carterae.1